MNAKSSSKLIQLRANLQKGPTLSNFIQSKKPHVRLPSWLKTKIPDEDRYLQMKQRLNQLNLNTVCVEAKCPNIADCWGGSHNNVSTATIMLMGNECTRACRFCSIKTNKKPKQLDKDEPKNTAYAISKMGVDYIVMTSVDRDDLEDFGANHFAETVKLTKKLNKEIMVECLTGDFLGKTSLVDIVCESGIECFAHNIETVRRLTPSVRDRRATYENSLRILKHVKQNYPKILTKTSIMLGLGETDEEIQETMTDLRKNNVEVVTLGQYMQPTKAHLKVVEYVTPQKFDYWKVVADSMGFKYCASGPLVRSSYRAGELFIKNLMKNKKI